MGGHLSKDDVHGSENCLRSFLGDLKILFEAGDSSPNMTPSVGYKAEVAAAKLIGGKKRMTVRMASRSDQVNSTVIT